LRKPVRPSVFFVMPDTAAPIVKTDAYRQLIFGWASVAVRADGQTVIDSQNDIVPVSDLEDAAYEFVLKFREMNERHTPETTGVLVESFVVTPDKLEKMGVAPDALPVGWWTGFFVPDTALFQKILDGEYTMFSIEGSAIRTPEGDA